MMSQSEVQNFPLRCRSAIRLVGSKIATEGEGFAIPKTARSEVGDEHVASSIRVLIPTLVDKLLVGENQRACWGK